MSTSQSSLSTLILFFGAIFSGAISSAIPKKHPDLYNNPAILVTTGPWTGYDISLNITKTPLICGVASWSDLAYTSLGGIPNLTMVADLSDVSTNEKTAIIDMASGRLCGYTDGCQDDVNTAFEKFVKLECDLMLTGNVYE